LLAAVASNGGAAAILWGEPVPSINYGRLPVIIEGTAIPNRRELVRMLAAVLAVAGLAGTRSAYGFAWEEMPAQLAKQYRDRCAADPLHAPTLEAAFARLDAAGVKYDRAAVAASLRCPVCGCSILSGPAAPDGARPE
jgi:hypothetical protein